MYLTFSRLLSCFTYYCMYLFSASFIYPFPENKTLTVAQRRRLPEKGCTLSGKVSTKANSSLTSVLVRDQIKGRKFIPSILSNKKSIGLLVDRRSFFLCFKLIYHLIVRALFIAQIDSEISSFARWEDTGDEKNLIRRLHRFAEYLFHIALFIDLTTIDLLYNESFADAGI